MYLKQRYDPKLFNHSNSIFSFVNQNKNQHESNGKCIHINDRDLCNRKTLPLAKYCKLRKLLFNRILFY